MWLFKPAKHADEVTKCPERGGADSRGSARMFVCGHDLEAQHSVAQAPCAEARELGRHWA
jgi:hypothetical protein